MPEIDPVILQLKAEVGKYQADVRAATKTVDQQLGLQEKKVKRLENEMRNSSGKISSTIKGLAGTFATAFTGRELVGLIDSFTRFQNNLRTAGLEGDALAAVQERLRQTASQYGVDLESLSTVFQKAALVQNELGASTEQIIRLNEITAAALKITGSSAAEAQGALLQLGQALGSGVVRAEEFNSILEGALPLAQAAARGIDGFGGSVSKLRAAIADGQITSQQFFEGVLAGGVKTLADAENATLTLSGAFTALRNELTLYFGEASKANGATASIAGAIKALADNLDVLIPILATVAVGLGVGYVANAVRATLATVTLGAAATATGTRLLAAFGGPVGIAITAVTLAIGYLATETETASAAVARLGTETDKLKSSNDALAARLRDAGVAVDGLGAASSDAASKVDNLNTAMGRAIGTAVELFNKLSSLNVLQLNTQRNQVRAERERFENPDILSGPGSAGIAISNLFGGSVENNKRVQALKEKEAELDRAIALELAALDAGISTTGSPSASSPSGTSTGSRASTRAASARTPSGPSLADIEERFQSERASVMQQYNSALQSMAFSAEEAAEYELRNLEITRLRTLSSIQADADYSDLQKQRLSAQVEELAEVERAAVEFQKRSQLEREAQDLAAERNLAELDGLRLQLQLADTQAERKDIALRILAAEDRYLQSKLEAVIASETATDAEQKRARIALEALQANAGARRNATERQNETEAERYVRGLNKTSGQINEALDGIKIDGLESLNDGLVDAITGAKSLGDVFSSVADQIIADLLRIAIQQAIIKPLAGAIFGGASLFGGSGGSGLLPGASNAGYGTDPFAVFGGKKGGGFFGRASGGRVDAGQIYRINEGASPGRVEAFRPDVGGQIIPLGQMAAMRSSDGGGGGTVRLVITEAAGFASKVEAISEGTAIEVVRQAAPIIVEGAVNQTFAQSQRPKI